MAEAPAEAGAVEGSVAGTPPPVRARRWPAVAAAAAVALIAGGSAVLAGGHRGPAPGGSAPTQQPGAPRASQNPAALVVHDDDVVEATGQVIAAPGKPVVYCPDLPQPAIGYPPGQEPAPSCPPGYAVTVVGVRLDQLTGVTTVRGVRVGEATLRGTWHDRVITVARQSAPTQYPVPQGLPEHPPCPPPAGGWRPGPVEAQAAQEYVQAHPDRFGQVWIGWPDGPPTGSTAAPGYQDKTQVLVVGVATGELAAAQRDLAAVYPGNLCVQRTEYSAAQAERVRGAASRLMDDQRNGIISVGLGSNALLPVEVELTVLDERVYRALAGINPRLLDLQPAIRPVAAPR